MMGGGDWTVMSLDCAVRVLILRARLSTQKPGGTEKRVLETWMGRGGL